MEKLVFSASISLFYDNMKKTGLAKICVWVLCWLLLVSCNKKTSDDPALSEESGKNRQEVLINIADNIIIPSYANFKVKLDVMINKSAAFTNTPTTTTLRKPDFFYENSFSNCNSLFAVS